MTQPGGGGVGPAGGGGGRRELRGHRLGRRGWTAPALLATALAVSTSAGCGSADLPASVAPTTPPTTTVEDLEDALDPTCVAAADVALGPSEHTVASGGVERSYLQYVPASYEGVAMPVVVSLHNTGATAAQQNEASGLEGAAEADGFVLLTPQALGTPAAWDAATASTDVAFIADLLNQAQADFCVAPQRVSVIGNGDGSVFAARLACDLSSRVASAGFVGVVDDPDPCSQERPVPLIVAPGFDSDLSPWIERYDCDPTATETPEEAGGTRAVYGGCADGAALETVSGADQATANDAFWAFFAAHPLTPDG